MLPDGSGNKYGGNRLTNPMEDTYRIRWERKGH